MSTLTLASSGDDTTLPPLSARAALRVVLLLLGLGTTVLAAATLSALALHAQPATPRDTALGAPTDAAPAAPRTRSVRLGATYATVGGLGLSVGALDARLRAAGLPGAPGSVTTIGSGAYATRGRLVLGASGHALVERSTERAGWRSSVRGGYALADVGLAPLVTPRALVAVVGGAGASRVTTKLRPVHGGGFDAAVGVPARALELSGHTALAHAGLLADVAVPWRRDGTLLVGLRAGWVGRLGHSRWRADEASLAGGPDVAPRGTYVRLSVGTPLGRRRSALLPALAPAVPWLLR